MIRLKVRGLDLEITRAKPWEVILLAAAITAGGWLLWYVLR